MLAYACKITPENFSAIASEMPHFNRDATMIWLEANGSGWFIRDESSVLDCLYLDEQAFRQVYMFADIDNGEPYRRILKI